MISSLKRSKPLGWIVAAAAAYSAVAACEPSERAPSGRDEEVVVGESKQPPPAPQAEAAAPSEPVRYPDFADLVERARPAVINIYTKTRQRVRSGSPFFPNVPRERVSESLGSGFIIAESGLALTNYHVIQGASDIEVRLLDERRFRARVIGQDPQTDTALVQIEHEGEALPYLELADSDALRVGEWVIAIGNPLGLTSTVTAGITSATGRRHVPLGGELLYQDFIQTDASINPGNSGGPLLNVDGEVVGINTAISAEAQGIGFAIPVNMVKELLPQLKLGKVERSWLGVDIDEVPEALHRELDLERGGALIKRVVRGGPAEIARLEAGDVITAFDGEAVRDADHLAWLAGHKGVGVRVVIDLKRGNQPMKTRLELGALPD